MFTSEKDCCTTTMISKHIDITFRLVEYTFLINFHSFKTNILVIGFSSKTCNLTWVIGENCEKITQIQQIQMFKALCILHRT